MKDTLSCS